MFNHRFDETPGNRVVAHWFMLSFNGGFINAGGFLATGRFVSHVTGFATLFGVDIASDQVTTALGILSVPLAFLLGSFIAGVMIERPLRYGRQPHFDGVMGLAALCLFLAAGGGKVFHFGVFGDLAALKQSYVLMLLLCMASGLQNGAITSSSGKSVRTTHMTGLTTDLGLGLARLMRTDAVRNKAVLKEVRANYLRFGSIASFVAGSAVGATTFVHYRYAGFIVPGLISLYAAWHGRKAKTNFWQGHLA